MIAGVNLSLNPVNNSLDMVLVQGCSHSRNLVFIYF